MKKKSIICITLSLILMMALLAGCDNESSDSSSLEDNVITIEKSDEAKEYEENNIVSDGVKDILSEENFDTLMQAMTARGEQVLPECEVENKLDCEEVDGSNVYTLTPSDDYKNVVLYTHGGAWTFEISEEHITFCDKLATRLNAKVYMPLYPLSPQADSEETYNVIEDLYKEIIKEGKKVYIMGDSAGGNITLGLMYTIKEEELTAPEKMVLIAPCSDMTFSNDEMQELNETDPELNFYGCSKCAEQWAGKENLDNPKNSAVYADVSGYPDTVIFQGTNDILCPDNLILYQNMKDAGVNITLVKGEGFWHVFPIYPIPEQDEALDIIEKFCAE